MEQRTVSVREPDRYMLYDSDLIDYTLCYSDLVIGSDSDLVSDYDFYFYND